MSEMRKSTGIGSNRRVGIWQQRVVFKWLPVAFSTDLEFGSWFYFWGSIIYMLIPLIPLVPLRGAYLPSERAVSGDSVDDDNISYDEKIFLASLLAFSGLLFAFGSYLLVRACRNPPSARLTS